MVACSLGEANLDQLTAVRARCSPSPELSLLCPARPCFPPLLLQAVVTACLPNDPLKCADVYVITFAKVIGFVEVSQAVSCDENLAQILMLSLITIA